MARSRVRWALGGGGAVVAVAAVALVVSTALVRPAPPPDQQLVTPPPPPPPPPPVLVAASGDAPAPTADGVREAIEALVDDPGLGRMSAKVVDVVTGESLYAEAADRPAVPASAVKLVTAVTLLASADPADRLATVAVAGQRPGEVVLVGGGDPTLTVAADGTYPQAARLDDLAEQVREALDGAPVTGVVVDSSLFTGPEHGPWDADIPDGGYVAPITALMTDGGRIDPAESGGSTPRYAEPDLAAGEAFAKLLGDEDLPVTRGSAPASAAELGRVLSPPLVRLVEMMLADSDNVVAEALARQVALAQDEPASFAGAAAAMTDVLSDLGVPVEDSELVDGSGLSRGNRLTATLLTDLLLVALADETTAGVVAGLPVAGWSGTLAERYRTPQPDTGPGAGVVRAKTGTLNGVNSLTGLVVTGDGRLLGFSLLANDTPFGAPDLLDRIAATLATCGCR